jgi:YD repeat-containing protein
MRILKMVLIGLAAISFVSCQKELSFESTNGTPPPPGPGPDPLGDLLVRSVTNYSTVDSVVTTYNYDAATRLIGITNSGNLSGTVVDTKQTINRDGSGNITQMIWIDPQVGTLTTDVLYDAANNRYSHAIVRASVGGFNYVDSTIFLYDGAGRISFAEDYELDPQGNYSLIFKNEYTYTGSGIDSVKFYQPDPTTGVVTYLSANVYGYDISVNPLVLSNGDAIVVGKPELYSPNNNNSLQSNGNTLTTIFVLNSKNKPVTSTSTYQVGAQQLKTAYYYQ